MSQHLKSIVSRAMSSSVTFVWPYGGEKVQLAGSFTGWKPVEMVTGDTNKWILPYNLSPGNHEFKFVVDGKWVHDPEQTNHVNELGSHNNILSIDPEPVHERSESPEKMSTTSSIDSDEGEWEMVQKSDLVLEKLPAKNPCMEIERKFVVPEDFKERLEEHGFGLVKEFEEVLQDKYYDTNEHHLLHKDYWLRQRNGDWELKYPVGPTHPEEGSTLYHETSNPEVILVKIRALIPTIVDGFEVFGGTEEPNIINEDLNEMLESGVIKPFAHLETKRQWFQKDDISIVIDDTDWGYRIGEIEILLTDPAQVSQAVDKIEELAKTLNFTDLDMVSVASKVGKVNEYLKKHNRRAYEIICQIKES